MKASLPKGTRDFAPEEVLKRKYIFSIIEDVFRLHGYVPIETPAMENLSTLTGKYGEEGDRLLFKILNNGDFLKKADQSFLDEKNSSGIIPSISKRGLRYDLTVPFARFVVMNNNNIVFPFKRYQIQPVWRADRPQKGRYQEFFQCDVDVVGSNSLVYEAELINIYDKVFEALGIKVKIKINNRKILNGIAEISGVLDRFSNVMVSIDKLDKIGKEGVINELINRGFSSEEVDSIISLIHSSPAVLEEKLIGSKIGMEGLDEIKNIYKLIDADSLHNDLVFDVTLARGLSYYTGCIFEVESPGSAIGSIGGGGRYDNLTEYFGLKNVSGVGISFGAERIFILMEEQSLFPANLAQQTKAIILPLDEDIMSDAFILSNELRNNGIACELYPSPVKLGKQMKYANHKKIPFAIIIGEEEAKTGDYTLKNMESGKQYKYKKESLIETLKSQ